MRSTIRRIIEGIAVITGLLTFGAVADTLPPLTNGAPQTVEELWAGYDPQAEPLDTEILYSWEEDGITLKVVRYRVGIFGGEKAMVAGVYGYPTGQSNLPALVNIHGGGQYADYRSCLSNAKRGYATLTVAWAGRISAPNYTVTGADMQDWFDNGTNATNYKVSTDWAGLEGYHAPSRWDDNVVGIEPSAWTIDDVDSPRNSGWFLWTMAARRGLTFLEQQPEVDGDSLGVYGHSMGGKLSVMTSGSDDRLKAAAPSCGGVSDRYKASALYNTTIGDSNYLAGVSCPIFFLNPANDFHGAIDDLPLSISQVSSNDHRGTHSPHRNHQDTAKYAVATQIWMDQYLKGSFVVPDSPEIQVTLNPGSNVPAVAITIDTNRTINAVEVYYTQMGEDAGEQQPWQDQPYRHWHSPAVQGADGNWTADLPVNSTNEPLWVYANVTYALDAPITGAGYGYNDYTADEFVLSSGVEMITSAELQAAGVTATVATTTLIEDFQGDWKLEWFNYSNDPNEWKAYTHKVNDPVYAAPQWVKLSLDVKSAQANTLRLTMDGATLDVPLEGSTEWQTIEVFPMEFLNAGVSWAADWDSANEFRVSNGGAVWSGADPEFSNLHWEPGTQAEYDAFRDNKLLELPYEDGKIYLTFDAAESAVSLGNFFGTNTWLFGEPLVVGGVTNSRGLSVHAESEIVYFLGSAFTNFNATALAGSSSICTIKMQVYLDDVLAFDSGDLTMNEYALIDLDVSGVSEMKLLVIDSGDGTNGDHGSWVDAYLTPLNPPPTVILTAKLGGTTAYPVSSTDLLQTSLDSVDDSGLTWADYGGAAGDGDYNMLNDGEAPLGMDGYLRVEEGTLDFNFDLTVNTAGYEINQIDTFTGNSGYNRVEQDYTVSYATVAAPTTFIDIATIDDITDFAVLEAKWSITENSTGILASNVATIRYVFPQQALDGVQYKEIDIIGIASIPEASQEYSEADELAYAADVSASDLLHGRTPVASGFVLGVPSLNDGVHGRSYADAGNAVEGAYSADGATAEFTLGAGANGSGYDITSIQSIAAWNGAAYGNQMWTVDVKPVNGSWTTLDTVDYQPMANQGASKVVLDDESGVLASGIEAIRFTANGAFVWREVDVFGASSTAPAETVPPTLVSISPDTPIVGLERSNVAVGTKLVAKFSEDVELGSGNITLVNLDSLVETVISLPNSQVEVDAIDPALLMVSPSSDLLENTRYAVRMDSTVIDDLAGNSFAGIADNSTWTFTTAHSPMKIFCIGDSITVGYTDGPFNDPFKFGYRGHLYQLLNDAGYVFQFVGDSPQPWVNNFGMDPTNGGTYKPAFDLRDIGQDYHQGGEGASIGAIQTWFQNPEVDPDLILLKIGINSIQNGVTADTVCNNISNLVETIVTEKPNAHLIVAQILPYSGNYVSHPDNEGKNQVLHDYNVYIRDTLVPTYAANGHKISTVDMYSMFLTDTNNYESAVATGRHSNGYNHPWNEAVAGAGYDTMAQRWFGAIDALSLNAVSSEKAKVFLLGGQSNMNGLGTNSELTSPYNAAQTNVAFWSAGDWVDLAPGFGSDANYFGPEVSFGYTVKQALPTNDVYLVKHAVNGTALYNDWAPGSGPQYLGFMSTARSAIADLEAGKIDYEIAGMLWLQGESDALENQGAAYETNLRNFIADMRTQFDSPELPFYMARVREFYGTAEQSGLVRTAQVVVAESTEFVEWFDTDSYNPLIEGGHYNTEGEINIGIDFANIYLGLYETFTSWASEQGLDGTPGKESGFFDDPDGDGLSNGVEAWFGTDPTVPGTGLSEITSDGTTTTFQHPQNTSVFSGVSISYSWSLDLTEWYAGDGIGGPDGGPTVSISSSTEVDITTTTATANEPLSTLFLRAGVIQD